MWKGNSPNSPPLRLKRADLFKVGFVGDFPDQSASAVVWRDNEGIALIALHTFEVSDFPECEPLNDHVMKNLEPVVYGSALGSGDESWLCW